MAAEEKILTEHDDFPVEIFIQDNQKRHIVSPEHWHICYEILYVLEGSAKHIVNQQEYRISSGDFVLIRCQEVHATFCRPSEDTKIMVVKFIPSIISEQFYRLSGSRYISAFLSDNSRNVYHLSGSEADEIKRVLNKLYLEYEHKNAAYELMIKSGVYELIACCVRFGLIMLPNALEICDYEKFLQVLIYIENHYRENITLQTVSQMLHLNYSYTSRYFKKATGKTFRQYLDYIRVCEAEKMLLNQKEYAYIVAEKCGYSSQQAFCRAFKRLRGYSPKVKKG